VSISCLNHPERPAVLHANLRAFVNHEVYFFCDQRSLGRFKKNPLKWCGLVTDPVSRARFQPTKESPRWDYGDQPFFFTSLENMETFKATPDSFAVRRGM
jgi:YHS domain-containing protein